MTGLMGKTILLDFLLAGFFAIACVRARGPVAPGQKLTFSGFFRLSDRLERLRRSRWQWFSMVALVLVLRMQQVQPLTLEVILVLQFLVFLALPTQAGARKRALAR
jgi:hypothetical protein